MYYIYALVCPLDKLPKYVGLSRNPGERLRNHLSMGGNGTKSPGENYEKIGWIQSLRKFGEKPEMILCSHHHTREAAFIAENTLISQMKEQGFSLFNKERKYVKRKYDHLRKNKHMVI